ncbi:hypothetical protein EDB87DRAFT_1576401 [Lactarius vividus]|nr:hypothetical protein EDB87DRAFT_1576401 [Lactarius vividus]
MPLVKAPCDETSELIGLMSDPLEEEFFCLFKEFKKEGPIRIAIGGTRHLLKLKIEADLSKKSATCSHPSLMGSENPPMPGTVERAYKLRFWSVQEDRSVDVADASGEVNRLEVIASGLGEDATCQTKYTYTELCVIPLEVAYACIIALPNDVTLKGHGIVKAPSNVRGGVPPGVLNLGKQGMPSIYTVRVRSKRHPRPAPGLTWAIRERGSLGERGRVSGVHCAPASHRFSRGPPLSGTGFLLVPNSNQ